jgi:hypothetical protein
LSFARAAPTAEGDRTARHVRRRRPGCEASEFVPRALYGEYLQDLLRVAQMQAPQRVRLEVIEGAATGVRQLPGGRGSPAPHWYAIDRLGQWCQDLAHRLPILVLEHPQDQGGADTGKLLFEHGA